MRVKTIDRVDLKSFLMTDDLRKGKMLKVIWPRKTDKKVRNPDTGKMEIIEPAGSLIERRLILRSDWTKPTKTYTPKGGVMFNVSKDKAEKIRKDNHLYLFLSLEGVTHPQGEDDHPVNVPLDRVCEIHDLQEKTLWRIVDVEDVTNVEIINPEVSSVL